MPLAVLEPATATHLKAPLSWIYAAFAGLRLAASRPSNDRVPSIRRMWLIFRSSELHLLRRFAALQLLIAAKGCAYNPHVRVVAQKKGAACATPSIDSSLANEA